MTIVTMTSKILVDNFLRDGCGRCELFRTPDCKVHFWTNELSRLRELLSEALDEELKWGHPVYTYRGKNVAMIGAFRDFCTLSFFKGALMSDPRGLLVFPGENSQIAKIIRLTSLAQIAGIEDAIREYVAEAIEIEKSGKKVPTKSIDEYAVPDELTRRFSDDPELETAFRSLTPGRQRGYLIHFSSAKQTKTRFERIDKCTPKILAGKGLNDH